MHTLPIIVALAVSLGCSPSSEQDSGPAPVQLVPASESAPAAEADVDAMVRALHGTYRHTGGQTEQAALERAVDEVVAGMNVLARPIARQRLLASNVIPTALRVEGDASRVTIAFDDRVYTASVDGPEVDVVGINGDKLKMTLHIRARSLVQRFAGPKGTRTNTFRREHGRLLIGVVVQSDSLPRVLGYTLTYARHT